MILRTKLRALPARSGPFLLAITAFATAACRKPTKPEAIEPAPSSSAEHVAEPSPDLEPPPLDIGPSAEASRQAREQAVFALLSGELAATALPEVATEPGQFLDLGLRDRLAPVENGLHDAPRKRGSASIGPADAPASIANANRVVAGMRAGFRACYQRSLEATPTIAGAVNMVIKVDAQGAVTSATAKSRTTLPDLVLTCMKARAMAAQFNPPADGKASTIKFTVTLSPQ
jgi:hypothetical protein